MRNTVIYILVFLFITSCRQGDNKNSSTLQKDGRSDVMSNKQKLYNNILSCANMNEKIFQYLFSPDVQGERFTLIFYCRKDSLRGIIFGPVPEGDEGLYFFKSNLDSITLANNTIRFSFVQGTLYAKPFTLKNYNKPFKNKQRGWSSYRLIYKGYFHFDTLTFICTSEYHVCYADTMNFIEKQKPESK